MPQVGIRVAGDREDLARFSEEVERVIAHLKNWRILHTDYRRPIDSFITTISAAIGLLFYSFA